ncbi:MAG: tRNA (guanosine(37)-N1)-methyltransferase TrmD [Clostridium sp.]|nr:tRNA (guanosine(37)-N1)-methyltransferase TrmD [Clostridium sp.]
MNFHIMTLFPEMVMGGLSTSITGRAMEKGIISVEAVNIRDYSKDKHRHVDDAPYGGGAGMVMQPGPICDAYDDLCRRAGRRPRVIYMTPQGRVFNQQIAQELAKEEELVFLCGHYEGIDERALELVATDYLSIGDYVLTGGELPAMVMIDCISRLVPGVLNNEVSAEVESFHDNLLEYPQYTRPEVFNGLAVPEVLLSGHHKNIEKWRREQSIKRTLERRPDLLAGANLSKKEQKYLHELLWERELAEAESGGSEGARGEGADTRDAAAEGADTQDAATEGADTQDAEAR